MVKCILIAIMTALFLSIFCFSHTSTFAESTRPSADTVKALYLSSGYLYNEKKLTELEKIIEETDANGIVIDFKDSNKPSYDHHARLVMRFKRAGAYTIARIVVFQDSYFARIHTETAIKTSHGNFWYSGKKIWKRYWLDPASPKVRDYTIEVAKKAIDAGYDEIQFDYIRFPTDGNMRDIIYPIFNSRTQTKRMVMKEFYARVRSELKSYAPDIKLGIDVFGEVFIYGKEPGIGQYLPDIAEYFDVVSPMAYPSHYHCNTFGVKDPTAYPYRVYFQTLKKGKEHAGSAKIIIRPWIQDFSISSIYRCGPKVAYTRDKVYAQIKAGYDLGIHGFMLWNVGSSFTYSVFK